MSRILAIDSEVNLSLAIHDMNAVPLAQSRPRVFKHSPNY